MTGCWYLLPGMGCDRPPGICEGCPIYDKWQKMREEAAGDWKIKLMKKEEEEK